MEKSKPCISRNVWEQFWEMMLWFTKAYLSLPYIYLKIEWKLCVNIIDELYDDMDTCTRKKNAWIFLYRMQYKFLVDMNYKNCINFYIKCIKCIFPVMNKSLHAIVVKMCTRRGDQLLHCWNYCPQPHRAHIHCLFSKHWRMSVCAIFFSTWGNSIAHLCFIQNSMSDYILSDCHLLHTNKM